MKYRGVFQATQEYARGDLVTFDGSIYHCNADTRRKPGNGSTDWTLCVKRGADGKEPDGGSPSGRTAKLMTMAELEGHCFRQWARRRVS